MSNLYSNFSRDYHGDVESYELMTFPFPFFSGDSPNCDALPDPNRMKNGDLTAGVYPGWQNEHAHERLIASIE